MTTSDAMDQAILEAKSRFTYIADAPTLDEWDTVKEFEARGGGDCDGWTLWCLNRASKLCPGKGCWWFVRGTVDSKRLDDGRLPGHAWAEIREGKVTYWADPTWNLVCADPSWFTGRTAELAYPVDEEIMGQPVAYLTT